MSPRSTLTSHTANVAMGPSRVLTSHLRNLYVCNYKERCTYPRIAFIADLSFVGAAIALVITAAWFAFLPVPQPGVSLTFAAPSLTAASPAAVDVTLRSSNGHAYRDVRLTWHLPPGAQVFASSPHMPAHGPMYLGEVRPDQEVVSRAVVRLFQPQGGAAEFGFTVSYTDEEGKRRQFFGLERRAVADAAIAAEVPAAFHTDGVVPEGAIIPIRIENRSNETLPFVHLLLRETTYHAEERITLGDMAAHEVRWAYIPLVKRETPDDPTIVQDGIARLSWSVGSAARNLVNGSWEARVIPIESPTIRGRLISRAGEPISIGVEDAPPRTSIVIMHPFLDEPVTERGLLDPFVPATFPAPRDPSGPNHEWFVAPIVMNGEERILGPASMGAMAAVSFPFTTQVRYTSSAGDQLGAGPHPPQVGIETRYWAFWTIGPIDTPLENLTVETVLPLGVTATGNTSAPNGGSFSATGRRVRWSLSNLGPVDNFSETGEYVPSAVEGSASIEHGISQAVFGFEISVTPSLSDVGSVLPLLATSTARAEDTHTPLLFEAEFGPLTSHLEEDGDGEGVGIVRETTE